MNQLSLNKDFGIENKPKSTNNNLLANKHLRDSKYKERDNKYNSNQEIFIEENKQEVINKPSINPISIAPDQKNEIKNTIQCSSVLGCSIRRENEIKDIKDISDFIKNKKNDKK